MFNTVVMETSGEPMYCHGNNIIWMNFNVAVVMTVMVMGWF